jgi:repressor LexA
MATIKAHDTDSLTPRQRQVLEFIISHLNFNGYPPTLREIAAHLGVSGPLPVSKHLEALEKKGYISRNSVSRGIRLTAPHVYAVETECSVSDGRPPSVSLPIVGTVRAGHLSPAIEDIQGHFSVDQAAVKGKNCFFLRVKGDSMISAGIFDNDLALVRPQATAVNRDIVVAMVEGEATLKRFYREKDRIRLQPANPNMDPIIIRQGEGEVTIVGKVIGVYRQLE